MPNETDILDFMLNDDCSNCGSARVEVSFDQLPKEMQDDYWTVDGNSAYHLYCPKCNKYETILYGGAFDEIEDAGFEIPANSGKSSNRPSLNAPCPCGSNKKYKRCCGKKMRISFSKDKGL